jgi:hypothetical protein
MPLNVHPWFGGQQGFGIIRVLSVKVLREGHLTFLGFSMFFAASLKFFLDPGDR